MSVSDWFASAILALSFSTSALAQQVEPKSKATYTRLEDVVYAHRDGVDRTMDVFTPKNNPNGFGVIIFVSAEYKSGRDLLKIFHPTVSEPFLDRGVRCLPGHAREPAEVHS